MNVEEIEDLIEEWHHGHCLFDLHEFLGWTEEEYNKFVENK